MERPEVTGTEEFDPSTPSPKALLQALGAMGARLDASLQLLSAISSLTSVPVRFPGLAEAAAEMLEILLRELNNVSACSMLLYNPVEGRLNLLAAKGQADLLGEGDGPYNLGLSFQPGEGVAGRVFSENRPRYWDRDTAGTDMLKVDPGLSTPESLACLPLSTADRCLGVLNISFGAPTPFDTSRKRDLSLLGGVTANIVQTFLLKAEVDEKAASLAKARDELEQRVQERTAELVAATQELKQEISRRQKAAAERARLEAQLHQTQRLEAIGTLAGGIAHDFNNILSAVIGYAQLVQRKLPERSLERRNLEQVLVASRRARDLIKQILTFSRQTDARKRPLLLGPIVKEVLKLLRASLPATIDFRVNLTSEETAVLADPSQIHQVLMNLGANAGQAMRETGGLLSINLANVHLKGGGSGAPPELGPGLYVKLTVSDTGPGMSPAVQARIFEPYFTTRTKDEGTGLGLSVVHGIVKNHGGAVTVDSTPGKGAAFHVYLPGIEPEYDQETAVTREPAGGDERILVVDDEPAVVDFLKQMLEELGYRVTARTGSLEALATFENRPEEFDLLLTDQTMPKLTGLELARKIKAHRPDLPVILCTGFSEQITPEKAEAAGVDALLLKPLLADEIAETIRRVLDE
ncbi:MAG: response regulator [Thermodesulfobacteriota bacterium]